MRWAPPCHPRLGYDSKGLAWKSRGKGGMQGSIARKTLAGLPAEVHTWKLGERSNNLWALTWDRILYMIGLFAEDGFSDAEIANVQSAFKLVD